MAFVRDEDEEQKSGTSQDNTTPVITSTGMSDSNPATPPTAFNAAVTPTIQNSPQKQTSGTFTNLQKYLSSNQGGAQVLGNQIGQTIGAAQQKATNLFNPTTTAFTNQINQGTNVFNEALANLAAQNASQYINNEDLHRNLNGQYLGPQNFAGSEEDAALNQAVTEAQNKAKLALDANGRTVLLRDILNTADNPNQTSQGGLNLNQFLVQNSNPAYNQVLAASKAVDPLANQYNQLTTDLTSKIQQAQDISSNTKMQALARLQAGMSGLQDNLTATAAQRTAQEKATNREATIQAALSSGQGLTPQQLAQVGLSQGQWAALQNAQNDARRYGGGINLSNFLTNSTASTYGAADVATEDQKKNLEALSLLTGNVAPILATGTKGSNANFDVNSALNVLSGQINQGMMAEQQRKFEEAQKQQKIEQALAAQQAQQAQQQMLQKLASDQAAAQAEQYRQYQAAQAISNAQQAAQQKAFQDALAKQANDNRIAQEAAQARSSADLAAMNASQKEAYQTMLANQAIQQKQAQDAATQMYNEQTNRQIAAQQKAAQDAMAYQQALANEQAQQQAAFQASQKAAYDAAVANAKKIADEQTAAQAQQYATAKAEQDAKDAAYAKQIADAKAIQDAKDAKAAADAKAAKDSADAKALADQKTREANANPTNATYSGADISGFIQNTLNTPGQTDAQKSAAIRSAASTYNVSVPQIMAATGYSYPQVMQYLNLSGPINYGGTLGFADGGLVNSNLIDKDDPDFNNKNVEFSGQNEKTYYSQPGMHLNKDGYVDPDPVKKIDPNTKFNPNGSWQRSEGVDGDQQMHWFDSDTARVGEWKPVFKYEQVGSGDSSEWKPTTEVVGYTKMTGQYGDKKTYDNYDKDGNFIDRTYQNDKEGGWQKAAGIIIPLVASIFMPGAAAVMAAGEVDQQQMPGGERNWGKTLGGIAGAVGGFSELGGYSTAAQYANTAGKVVNAANALENKDYLGALASGSSAIAPGSDFSKYAGMANTANNVYKAAENGQYGNAATGVYNLGKNIGNTDFWKNFGSNPQFGYANGGVVDKNKSENLIDDDYGEFLRKIKYPDYSMKTPEYIAPELSAGKPMNKTEVADIYKPKATTTPQPAAPKSNTPTTSTTETSDGSGGGGGGGVFNAPPEVIGKTISSVTGVPGLDYVASMGIASNNQRTDYASGGAIHGPGTETSDSIPAKLSNGEFVVNADSVKMPGVKELLEYINSLGLQKRGIK